MTAALGRAGLAGVPRKPIPQLPEAAAVGAVVTDTELIELYRLMTAVRHLDQAAIAWQRQGILPAYAPELGQEAAQVGSALAMDTSRDFIFPTYRELGVARAAGVDMVQYMSTHLATWHGGLWDPAATHVAPIQAVVAGSVLHAVGWAHGQTLAAGGTGTAGAAPTGPAAGLNVAITYLGDGASSQGDVHEAMNFAGVFKAPVVFFVQNNGWAISVPTERQVAGGRVAARGAGYAIPALQVDGNDAAAVLEATRRAVAHARAGHGPVIIEAMTYRRGPHATSDDPGRYRSLDAERADGGADPLARLRERIIDRGIADAGALDALDADAAREAEVVRAGVLALGPRPGAEMFDFVFTEPTDELLRQKKRWKEESDWREESEHA
ncbi:pyruvate dehydrogenase E1 component subunit alpha [Sinomonas cyclohexanicum]|uniref:2-oxoisovalerate dehydrogenase subunit alpha n=2 Tax=Sinomonas cyclohexanicum TaxID=322009 RepID=A0ABM7PWK4_SINCY|nr:pyruvate dehydrogenase E1 component subunit alpha [Corynebacterium cyclohexanicum]